MAFIKRESRTVIVEWKDSYSVGINELDIQHHRLLDLIIELEHLTNNQHESSSRTKCFAALNSLVKYAETHFSTEEDYLKKYEYPAYDLQKTGHEHFVDNAFAMNQQLEEDKCTILEICIYLQDWYTYHILGMDQEYRKFLAEKGVRADQESSVGTI